MSKAHRSTRPKGYLTVITEGRSSDGEWKPSADAYKLINQVKSVIDSANYAMSVRFIFYRLVGNFGYPKTERDYKNLAELLVKARRAQLISFRSIADSGTETAGGIHGWSSRSDFLESYKDLSDYFGLREDMDQPYHIELWSEDAGSIPMLNEICRDWPVTIYSTGGFSSVTVTHQVAQRVLSRNRPTIFLHVGDYDPSGESIYKSMSQDIGAFVSGEYGSSWNPETGETNAHPDNDGYDFRPIRVALTEDQTIDWDLETAPPKATDSRSVNWIGETVQVQAMTEDQMREVVVGALTDHTDVPALNKLRRLSRQLRDEMRPIVEDAFDNIISELGE